MQVETITTGGGISIREGLVLDQDGKRVRVDRVANGQVYYVSWRPGDEIGSPRRTPIKLFKEGVRREFPR